MTERMSWPQLALLTLQNPTEAAHHILGWKLPRDVLWMALLLVCIANTLIFITPNVLLSPVGAQPVLFTQPLAFFAMVVGGLVLTIYALVWVGRFLGATGSVDDLLALLVWLQTLRAVGQLAVLFSMVTIPLATPFLILVIGVAALWIFINFISVGLQFYSLGRAIVALVASVLAIVFALSVLLSLAGVDSLGLSPYV